MGALMTLLHVPVFLLVILFTTSSDASNQAIPQRPVPIPLPAGFVFLHDIDPTIVQSSRYFGSDNFMGRKVPGYVTEQVILSLPAARALTQVQAELRKQGLTLVVYDGYRPQRAVDAFVKWSEDPSDEVTKASYYPTLPKADLFRLGYIAKRSGHCRGSTVDVTIMKRGRKIHSPKKTSKILTDGSSIPYLDDGTMDMGSSYDLFHKASHHDSPLVSKKATSLRNFLRAMMKKHGFKELPEEWWHYTLTNEPYPKDSFDFTPA